MATTTSLTKKWKIKHITPGGVWLPQKGKSDCILFGNTSSERIKNANKLRLEFKGELDQSYIYEVGEDGKLIATFKPNIKRFILSN